jgi:hypothetical protein
MPAVDIASALLNSTSISSYTNDPENDHNINLYKSCSGNDNTIGDPWSITSNDFKKLFFTPRRNILGNEFHFPLLTSTLLNSLDGNNGDILNMFNLFKWKNCSASLPENKDFKLPKFAMDLWYWDIVKGNDELDEEAWYVLEDGIFKCDASGCRTSCNCNSATCSSCSSNTESTTILKMTNTNIAVKKDLTLSSDLRRLAGRINKESMTWGTILEYLDGQDNGNRQTTMSLKKDDILVLILIVTNENDYAKNIFLRLNFKIV